MKKPVETALQVGVASFALFFPDFVRLSPFLILPFAVGNILVSHRYRYFNANTMYFADLLGATGGILFSIVFIPLLTTENALLLNLLLLIPALWLLLSDTLRRRISRSFGRRIMDRRWFATVWFPGYRCTVRPVTGEPSSTTGP